jgi:hypothetical protein
MASKGRNGDSMLVHMTPGEVYGLQALAMKHGGTLTTNPDTGLPEANFLKSLLPMIAGFALGPAGFGLVSSGLTAGAIVGGVTGLATGSLSKGLMAGLGAYGGFGIGESLAAAGAGALTDSAASSAYGASAGMTDVAAQELGFASAEEAAQNAAARAARNFDPSQIAGFDKATAGFNAATSSGGAALDFAKNNKLALGMAAAPIMADMMVPTTTKMPTNTNPAYIRQYVTGDRPQAPRALTPVLASEFGSRNFSDAYASPMATGGIVALAEGGVAHFEGGGGINEYDNAPGGGGDGNYSVREDGTIDYFNQQFAPDYSTPVVTAPVTNTGGGSNTLTIPSFGASWEAIKADKAAGGDGTGNLGSGTGTGGITNLTGGGGGTFEYNGDTFYSDSGIPVGSGGVNLTNTGAGGITNLTGGGGGVDLTGTGGGGITNLTGGGGGVDLAGTGGGGITNLAGAATTPYYFQVNPDVAAEYARNPMGLTPEQFAQAHYTNFGKKEGREFEMSAAVKNKTDIVGNTLKWIDDNPFATPEQITAAIKGSGMSTGDANRALDSLVASGKITESERYFIQQGKGLSGMADSGAKWLKDNAGATQTQIDAVLKAAKMDTTDAQRVLAHGFQVAEDQMAAAKKYITDNKDVALWINSKQGQEYIKAHPEFDAQDIAFTHYKRYGEKEGRKWGIDKKVVTTGGTGTGGTGGVNTGNITDTVLPTNPQTNAPPGTTNPYGNINNPGDLTFNPDGTVTVQPNLPGRPYGGYSGITELTNAYTAGGGSTGYLSPVVGSAFDHDIAYNKQTEDSLAAFNYLIGKGGAKYPSKSRASEIMKPYEEAVLGYPSDPTKKKYINVGGKMVLNPDYKAPTSKVTTSGNPNVVPKETPRTGYQWGWNQKDKKWEEIPITADTQVDSSSTGGEAAGGLQQSYAMGGYAVGGGLGTLGGYSDGGRLLKGPGDGVSDSIPATIGRKQQPARLADGEFVVPARIVSELGNGSTDAGARKLYAMMDRVQKARGKTTGKKRVATNTRADKYLPA